MKPPPDEVNAKYAAAELGVSKDTIYRLWHRGYIRARALTPHNIVFDLASILAHAQKTRSPHFWSLQEVGNPPAKSTLAKPPPIPSAG